MTRLTKLTQNVTLAPLGKPSKPEHGKTWEMFPTMGKGSLGNVSEFLIGSKKILQKFYEVRDLNAFLSLGSVETRYLK